MKKAIVITVFFVVFLILYFIQTNFFSWYNIAGIKPNLFLVFTIFIGLFLGKTLGFSLGIVFGLFLDLFIGQRIGLNAIMIGLSGLLGGILDKSFSKESRITFMGMTFAVTIICEFIIYIIKIIILGVEPIFTSYIKIVIIEAIYNAILVMILYPLIQKCGNITEEVFNERKRTIMRYY